MNELNRLTKSLTSSIASKGCPEDIAKEAAKILAKETIENYQRTVEDQKIIDRAWRYFNDLPPIDGAVLGG